MNHDDLVRTRLSDELSNGPDAHSPIPNACPSCGGDVQWAEKIEWQYYPDGGVFTTECENCGAEEEVDLRADR